MKLSEYREKIISHDWYYEYTTDTDKWKMWQSNIEGIRELSMQSARHRCLYYSYNRKHILQNEKLNK